MTKEKDTKDDNNIYDEKLLLENEQFIKTCYDIIKTNNHQKLDSKI